MSGIVDRGWPSGGVVLAINGRADMTTAKFRGYGVEINGALQNVSFDESPDAEDWVKAFIKSHHLRGGVTIKLVRTNVVLAEDQT